MALSITKLPKKVKFKDIPIGTCFVLANVDTPSSVHYRVNAVHCVSISTISGIISNTIGFSDTEEFILVKITSIDMKAEEI